ncbi:hypothetical protein [Fuscibacter oryzae]|uniref:Uncharacterized protein n=1 Tax=Fuscibacter oryzae TaxID=2803939 RepID=A0A8J7SW03_9RHOB|nr:hypothetical protein [Fuscibacter oryzae]MBL4930062.1 hypothetical protein [Fuscibacter oryzae]
MTSATKAEKNRLMFDTGRVWKIFLLGMTCRDERLGRILELTGLIIGINAGTIDAQAVEIVVVVAFLACFGHVGRVWRSSESV